jgi:uncharacterized membrane protein YGL010W
MLDTMKGLVREAIASLYKQHAIDLQTYRSAHRNVWNIRLHRILIPVEVFALSLAIAAMIHTDCSFLARTKQQASLQGKVGMAKSSRRDILLCNTVIMSLGWILGLVAVLLSPTLTGLWTCALHVGISKLTIQAIEYTHNYTRHKNKQADVTINRIISYQLFLSSAILWVISWSLQIVVGHWLLEGGSPNLGKDSVSLLAMMQSILIAWEY